MPITEASPPMAAYRKWVGSALTGGLNDYDKGKIAACAFFAGWFAGNGEAENAKVEAREDNECNS